MLPQQGNARRRAAEEQRRLCQRTPSPQPQGIQDGGDSSCSMHPEERLDRQKHRMQPEEDVPPVLDGRVRYCAGQYQVHDEHHLIKDMRPARIGAAFHGTEARMDRLSRGKKVGQRAEGNQRRGAHREDVAHPPSPSVLGTRRRRAALSETEDVSSERPPPWASRLFLRLLAAISRHPAGTWAASSATRITTSAPSSDTKIIRMGSAANRAADATS